MQYSDIPFKPKNPAQPPKHFIWPNGKTSCLFLSFDFDAEAAWFDENPSDWNNEVRISLGAFCARVGVPKILELLELFDLKATFFIPAWTVEAHTKACESILKAGHEIGHHGGYHLQPNPNEPAKALEEIEMGFETLSRVLGVKPVGYRAPLGENCVDYLKVLAEGGIEYSSSWRDDILPYRHIIPGISNAPIELPGNYFFDDWMHGMIKGSQRNLLAREQVLSMWRDELEITHEWGGLLTTIFHPQVSGRPSRFKILREFLQNCKDTNGLWIATGAEINDHFRLVEQSK